MKNTAAIFLILVAGMLLASQAWAKKIVVVQSRSLTLYEQAWQGFKAASKQTVEKIDLAGDLGKGKNVIESFNPGNTDMVVTIGTEATMLAKKHLDAIPLVYFMIVESPRIEGRISSGVLMGIKVEKQFKMISKLLPDKKRLGVVYNVKYTDNIINEARQMADYYKLNLLAIAVETNEDLAMAVQKFKKDNVDMIWSVLDPVIMRPENIELMIKQAKTEKLPFIGLSEQHVRGGALMAFTVNFEKLGQQSARLADSVLKEGISLPEQSPEQIVLFVNGATEAEIGVTIPKIDELEMTRF